MNKKLLFYILALYRFASPQDVSSLCPRTDGIKWIFDYESTACWHVGEKVLNFNQSQSYCEMIEANLASITNLEEFDVAMNMSQPLLFPPWTGIYYSQLFWRNTDGSSGFIPQSYWQAGEPSRFGDCAVFRAAPGIKPGLASIPCDSFQFPMCKYVPKICPTTTYMNGMNGTFTSPNYPHRYYNHLDCRWLIRAPNDKAFITITFDDYQVDTPDDFVAFYEGDTIASGKRIDIYNDPKTQKNFFESKGPAMTVLFHTSSDANEVGFSATYEAITDYANIVQNGTSGQMTSPNYPKNYDDLVDQSYYINSPPGLTITATFDVFKTEESYDVLYIYDGPIIDDQFLIANCSGLPITPMTFKSTKSSMSMRFMTDESYSFEGWEMSWKAV